MPRIPVKFNNKKFKTIAELKRATKLSRDAISNFRAEPTKVRLMRDDNNNVLKLNLKTDFVKRTKDTYGIRKNYPNKEIYTIADPVVSEVTINKKKYATDYELEGTDRVNNIVLQVYVCVESLSEPVGEFTGQIVNGKPLTKTPSRRTKDLLKKEFLRNIGVVTSYYTDVPNCTGKLFIRKIEEIYTGTVERIQYVQQRLLREILRNSTWGKVLFYSFVTFDTYREMKLKYDRRNIILRQEQPLKYSSWNVVDFDQGMQGNCVKNALKNKFPELKKNILAIQEKDNGVTYGTLLSFLNENNLNHVIYDGVGSIIDEYHDSDSEYIYGVAHNKHFYLLSNRNLRKTTKYDKVVFIDDASKKVLEIITNENTVPQNICVADIYSSVKYLKDAVEKGAKSTDTINILSFVHEGIKYIQNEDYLAGNKILQAYDIKEKLSDNCHLTNVFKMIDSKIQKKLNYNCDSFFFDLDKLKFPDYTYVNKKYTDANGNLDYSLVGNRKIDSIDKNKAYTYSLYSLPFLLSCDARETPAKKYNGEEIVPSALYEVKPREPNIWIPFEAPYDGDYLLFVNKYGKRDCYEIINYINCETHENHYKDIIDNLLSLSEKGLITMDQIKDTVNHVLGTFESTEYITYCKKFKNIIPADEVNMYSGHVKWLSKDYALLVERIKMWKSPMNKFPIRVQVKHQMRRILIEKIIEMGLIDDEIIKVHTDSITYIDNGFKHEGLDPKNFRGWKREILKPAKLQNERIYTGSLLPKSNNNNILYLKYAGCGKSYKVINEIIPELEKEKKTYLILTPSHKALQGYKDNEKTKYHTDVIQKYTIQKIVPLNINTIIIDEIGLCDKNGWNFLYVMMKQGIQIIGLGDFKQLLAFGRDTPMDNEIFLNYMFSKIEYPKTDDINYRNNFNLEYYQKIIDSKSKDYLLSQVYKHSTSLPYEAEKIICYRKTTSDRYNKLMLGMKGLKRYDIGTIHICKTLDYIDEDLVKTDLLEIIDKEKNGKNIKYTLLNTRTNKTHIINKRIMYSKKFDLGYAINIHQFQSSECKSYYWATDDDMFIDNRIAYVIVSRIKEEKNETKHLDLLDFDYDKHMLSIIKASNESLIQALETFIKIKSLTIV